MCSQLCISTVGWMQYSIHYRLHSALIELEWLGYKCKLCILQNVVWSSESPEVTSHSSLFQRPSSSALQRTSSTSTSTSSSISSTLEPVHRVSVEWRSGARGNWSSHAASIFPCPAFPTTATPFFMTSMLVWSAQKNCGTRFWRNVCRKAIWKNRIWENKSSHHISWQWNDRKGHMVTFSPKHCRCLRPWERDN